MKKVLFLAPNYRYICTTITGLSKDLMRHKVSFITNVPAYPNSKAYKEGEELYLRTNGVEVIFNHEDPINWTLKTFHKVDAIYGKKELRELVFEKFPGYLIPDGKDSLQRYITGHTDNTDNTDILIDDIKPKTQYIPEIKNAYFNDPMTVVIWADGTKTIVQCQEDDVYDKEVGLALCIAKKALGNKGNFNNVFKKWISEEGENK